MGMQTNAYGVHVVLSGDAVMPVPPDVAMAAATEALEASVGVQNLFDSHHAEFRPLEGVVATEPQRSVYAEVTWRFQV